MIEYHLVVLDCSNSEFVYRGRLTAVYIPTDYVPVKSPTGGRESHGGTGGSESPRHTFLGLTCTSMRIRVVMRQEAAHQKVASGRCFGNRVAEAASLEICVLVKRDDLGHGSQPSAAKEQRARSDSNTDRQVLFTYKAYPPLAVDDPAAILAWHSILERQKRSSQKSHDEHGEN